MSSQIVSNLTVTMKTQKTIVTNDPTAAPLQIYLDLQAPAKQFNATSPEPGGEAVSLHVPLVGGVGTIDLTSMVQAGTSPNVNATGLKLRSIQVMADSTNTDAGGISVGTGAVTGYPSAGKIGPLHAGGHGTLYTPGSVAVDATHKILDVIGAGTEGCSVHMVFGA
jgi:hypothetical protein